MKNDTDTIEINLAKTHASSEKYFALFDKYIANTYNENSTILLYDICNEGCIELIVNKNPTATYVVYDCQEMKDILPVLIPSVKFIFVNNSEVDKPFEYNLSDMKFDCIIMNPPYQRNLHLKILEKAIEHLKDDNSVCVNLSPVRWLQDPLAKYKKKSDYSVFENSVSKHINNITILSSEIIKALFDIQHSNLGLYVINTNTYTRYLNYNIGTTINTKILNFITSNKYNSIESYVKHKLYSDAKPLYYIYVLDIYGGDLNGSLFIKPYKYVSRKASTSTDGKYDHYIEFNTEQQAINFSNSARTKLFKYLMLTHKTTTHYCYGKYFPWMGDVINPRTGLKGYESEWIDEDFYTYFNITLDEQKIIEETMKNYK